MTNMHLNEIDELRNLSQYEDFFLQHYVLLCSFARRYVGRVDVAEDIVSETFVKIWEKRNSLKITTSFKSYLYQSVMNNALMYLRKQKNEIRIDDLTEFGNARERNLSFTVEDHAFIRKLEWENFYDQVLGAIEQLPPQQKQVFKLKRFEGKRNQDIAILLDISVKTVEMHLSKAMNKLRETFRDSNLPNLLFIFGQKYT